MGAGGQLDPRTGLDDLTGSGTISALNGTVIADTRGAGSVSFSVSGTWVGTLVAETDVGTGTWVAVAGITPATSFAVSWTSNNVITVPCGGYPQVRLRASAYTSGTINITWNSGVGSTNNPVIVGYYPTNQTYVPIQCDDQGRLVTSALTGFNAAFVFGQITTAATTQVVVRGTAYTEPAANAQRSISSANVNDTSAGTGARTVRLTYYDTTGAGPFNETITLNGTTAVNTVATNIRFIESIRVLTAGSGGVNAGIITLFGSTGGGGGTVGTIAAGNNRTYWAHHYVQTGKTINITGLSCGHSGTTVGSGGVFQIYALDLATANAVDVQAGDFVRLYGQSSTITRGYLSPIKVVGPARITVRVTPETASSTIYRASIDFFEP